MLLFVSFTFGLMASEPITITLAFEDKDSFPNYLGKGKKVQWEKPGYAVEFLKLVEREAGVKIKFIRKPWKRCLASMNMNKVDGAFNASFKKARMKMGKYPTKNGKVDPNRRIAEMSYVFFKLKDSKIEWNGEKLLNLDDGKVGSVLGYSISDILKKKGFPVDDGVNNAVSLLNKLVVKRVPVIISSELQIKQHILQNPKKFKDVVKIEPAYQTKPYYVMFSHKFVKEHPKVAKKVWDTIGKLRDTQKVKDILIKYLSELKPESGK